MYPPEPVTRQQVAYSKLCRRIGYILKTMYKQLKIWWAILKMQIFFQNWIIATEALKHVFAVSGTGILNKENQKSDFFYYETDVTY